ITIDPNLPIEASRKIVQEANKIIKEQGELLYLSSAIGSEAGVMSIGSGSGIDHISITATYVDRYHRKETIWQIETRLRKELNKIKNVQSVDVVDDGATALASLRANIDVTLYSDDLKNLQKAGNMVADAMHKTGGVVSVSKTWQNNKKVYEFEIDEKKAAYYGLSNEDISKQLQAFIRGAKAASFYLQNQNKTGPHDSFCHFSRDVTCCAWFCYWAREISSAWCSCHRWFDCWNIFNITIYTTCIYLEHEKG
ncbi:MAG: efflux RND transporter permease subunit, partial [Epsilonproteobacteria bacterium]|nr:efflux RND transporter permease subunit [Campylobacterota bacterium]